MAKQNQQQQPANDDATVFQLESGRMETVQPALKTHRITCDGKKGGVAIPLESLQRLNDKGEKVWRWVRTRRLPVPVATVANRDEFFIELARYLDQMVAFDSTSRIRLPDADGGASGTKNYKLCVSSDARTALSPENTLLEVIRREMRLRNQRQLRTIMVDAAEPVLRAELNIPAPTGSRTRGATASVASDDGFADE